MGNTPKYTNYTTTTSYADVLTVTNPHHNFLVVNTTGEDIEITFDGESDTRYFIEAAASLVIDRDLTFESNIRARAASGGAGAAGLHVTVW